MDEVFAKVRYAHEDSAPFDIRHITPMSADAADDGVKKTLLNYTRWLDRRGFFREDMQCDFEHQIETFLNDFNK